MGGRLARAAVRVLVSGALTLGLPATARAQRPGPPGAAFTSGVAPDTLEAVEIHPIVAAPLSCSEHALHGTDPIILGDAAGVDCTVVQYDTQRVGRRPPRHYEGDGRRNEDWFGWGETLLAPFDAVIEEVHVNPVTNEPGTPGQGPSSFIVFLRSDGTRVSFGHVQDVRVAQGDTVVAGQPVGAVGNNGFGYMPHTHVGAWRGDAPLQIRFDLIAMAELQRRARDRPAGSDAASASARPPSS